MGTAVMPDKRQIPPVIYAKVVFNVQFSEFTRQREEFWQTEVASTAVTEQNKPS